MSLIKEMERRYNALTSSQKERCQLIRINWVPNIDTILVEIRGLDETNERLFRQWIADYSFLKIIEEEIYMPQ